MEIHLDSDTSIITHLYELSYTINALTIHVVASRSQWEELKDKHTWVDGKKRVSVGGKTFIIKCQA